MMKHTIAAITAHLFLALSSGPTAAAAAADVIVVESVDAPSPSFANRRARSKSAKYETSYHGKSGKGYDCGSLSLSYAYAGKSGKGSKKSSKGSKIGTMSMSYSGKSGKWSKCGSKRSPTNPTPPTPAPTPLPTIAPIFTPSCPANTSSCMCGTCTAEKCTYTKGAGEDKRPSALCLVPPSGTCTVGKPLLTITASKKVVDYDKQLSVTIKHAAPINYYPDKCLNGWYWDNIVPDGSDVFDSIDVSSPCVNGNNTVTINTSCGCPLGLCYTFGGYTITRYQLYGDTTWHYANGGCPNTNPGSATCS